MNMYYIAYRHLNGEVEGFKGYGFTEETAKNDALEQVRRKLRVMSETDPAIAFHPLRVVETQLAAEHYLSREEMEQVRRDWATNVRY